MEFEFYLDAWLHCRRHKIPTRRIKKVGFKLWRVSAKG